MNECHATQGRIFQTIASFHLAHKPSLVAARPCPFGCPVRSRSTSSSSAFVGESLPITSCPPGTPPRSVSVPCCSRVEEIHATRFRHARSHASRGRVVGITAHHMEVSTTQKMRDRDYRFVRQSDSSSRKRQLTVEVRILSSTERDGDKLSRPGIYRASHSSKNR